MSLHASHVVLLRCANRPTINPASLRLTLVCVSARCEGATEVHPVRNVLGILRVAALATPHYCFVSGRPIQPNSQLILNDCWKPMKRILPMCKLDLLAHRASRCGHDYYTHRTNFSALIIQVEYAFVPRMKNNLAPERKLCLLQIK